MNKSKNEIFWWSLVAIFITIISTLHYITPTTKGHLHLIYLQSYFIPILISAFQFGVRGGLGVAFVVSLIYVPHIMLQWLGNTEHTLLGILQIIMFNIIGYLTGLKAQKEKSEKQRYQQAAWELEQSLEKLKRQSNELADLEEQLRLSDRLAVVGELTASLAHELRNPLATIRGTVEILNEELPPETKKTEFFQILIEETERMSSVVENYLNFARKQKNPDSQYDVQKVIESVCLILTSRARKERVQLHKELPEQPVILKGDPNDLHQVLINLLLNAIEAMPEPGTVRTSAQLYRTDDRPGGSPESESEKLLLRITIKDQGKGMEPDEIKKIFQPFYTTKKKGTGLGLSIVKRIVDHRDWKIEVNSEPSRGTEFVLMIPVPTL